MKKILFGLSVIFAGIAAAQSDYTLYQLNNVHQSSYVNLTNRPKSKISIGLPVLGSFYFNAGNSGFSYNDIIKVRQDDSLELDMTNVISKLKARNFIENNLQIDYISAGFYVGKDNYFTVNVSEKINSRFTYPKDLIVLLWEGNGKSLLGQRANLDYLGYDLMQYREFAVGYNRELNDKLMIGGRVKYLKGIANIYTKNSTIGLTTDKTTFDLTADGQMSIYTSGINELSDTNYTFTFNNYMFKKNNSGLGIDVGVSYQLTEKLKLALNVIDFGYIKWNYDTRNFSSDTINFTFSGVDLKDFIGNNDSTNTAIAQQIADSIANTFQLNEFGGSYKTPLYTQIYLNADYQLTEKITLNALGHAYFIHGRFRPSLTLGGTFKLTHFLSLAANYSAYNNSYTNFGAGIAVNLGPVQWYFSSNNVLGAFAPYLTKNAHFRTGINLIFGRQKKQVATQSQIE